MQVGRRRGADYRESRDRSHEGIAEQHRGQALQEAGRPDEAAEAFRAAAAIFKEVGDRREEGIALSLLGGVLPEAQRDEAIAAFEAAIAVLQDAGEPKLERAVTSSLLSPRFPAASAAELRARTDAGAINEIAPGLWIDVHVLGDQDDEERQRIVKEIRAGMRKAGALTGLRT